MLNMFLHFLTAFLIFFTAQIEIIAQETEHICGLHQHFDNCSSICVPRCPSKFRILIVCPKPEPPNCRSGCVCDTDYVSITTEQDSSICILEKYCPAPGDPNAVFTECKAACQRTCERHEGCCERSQCVSGYTCTEGLIRNSTGYCVDPSQC